MGVEIVWEVAAVVCTVLYAIKRQWILTVAWSCLAIYVLLDRLVHMRSVPAPAVDSFSLVFLALIVYDTARKVKSRGG